MSPIILPDTAIAAIASETDIFTYAQLYYGGLAEAISADGGKTFTNAPIPETSWNSVKPFTPLAATLFNGGQARYVFYLDRTNTLNDVVYENGNWRVGNLGDRGIVVADYSKLTVVTLPNHVPIYGQPITLETIFVFYQSTDKGGDIRVVRGSDRNWQPDNRDFRDPPLFGTSLAAVLPQPGVTIFSDSIPVVFFQEDNLRLAELQAKQMSELQEALNPKASPHTPLAAVNDDNGKCIYFFYTSDDNVIRLITIDSDGQLIKPFALAATTPKGNIAAVIWKKKTYTGDVEELVAFYQPQTSNDITSATPDDGQSSTNVFARVSSSLTLSSQGSRVLSDPVIRAVTLNFK